MNDHPNVDPVLPRITIQFCTQCKWMLRAAYFAQELLSTFSTAIGEVALIPATGGIFKVAIQHEVLERPSSEVQARSRGIETVTTKTLWDRGVDGGFPETKELKRRVRDCIQPGRNLGHVDRTKDGEGLVRQEESSGKGKEEVKEEGMREGTAEGTAERTAEGTAEGKVEAGGSVCEDCELQT